MDSSQNINYHISQSLKLFILHIHQTIVGLFAHFERILFSNISKINKTKQSTSNNYLSSFYSMSQKVISVFRLTPIELNFSYIQDIVIHI